MDFSFFIWAKKFLCGYVSIEIFMCNTYYLTGFFYKVQVYLGVFCSIWWRTHIIDLCWKSKYNVSKKNLNLELLPRHWTLIKDAFFSLWPLKEVENRKKVDLERCVSLRRKLWEITIDSEWPLCMQKLPLEGTSSITYYFHLDQRYTYRVLQTI